MRNRPDRMPSAPQPVPVEQPTVDLLRAMCSTPIVQSFPQGIVYVFDHDLRFVGVGGKGLAAAGLSSASLVDHTIFSVFSPEMLAVVEPHYRSALVGVESAVDVQFHGRSYHQSFGPIHDAEGMLIGGLSYQQDITERREYEWALLNERRRLREAESIGRMGSWDVDARTGVISWSDALLEMREITREQFENTDIASFPWVHPYDRAKVHAAIDSCRNTGTETLVRYRENPAKDGSFRWFDARSRGVFENGEMVLVAGTVVDVTADVVAAQQAAADNAFQLAVVSASPDIIFVYDLEKRAAIWTNRSVFAMLGYPAHEDETAAAPNLYSSLVPPGDLVEFTETLVAAREAPDDRVIVFNHRLIAADGTNRWFSRRTTPLRRDAQGWVVQVVGVLRDITDSTTVELLRIDIRIDARRRDERELQDHRVDSDQDE